MRPGRIGFDLWLLRASLRFYPPQFRVEFGADMAETYTSARAACASRAEIFSLWYRSVRSVLAGGIAERVHASRRRGDRKRGVVAMNHIGRDLKLALRVLRARPVSLVVTLLTLALGIGANTAVFTVVNATLLQPLPYPNAERLVAIGEVGKVDAGLSTTSFATMADVRAASRTLDTLATSSYWTATITSDGPTERYDGLRVSHEFFGTLGIRPFLGRDFTADDDVQAHRRRAILSFTLWRDRFHGDTGIVGRFITLSGYAPYEVIGVLPRGFVAAVSSPGAVSPDIFAPLAYDASLPQACRDCRHLRAIGRLAPDATATQARAEIATIFSSLVRQFPQDYDTVGVAVEPLQAQFVAPVRTALLVLWGAVVGVLLIACANVAHLRLASMADRDREFAIRLALGAGRSRLIRQLLVESVLVAVAGGALGLLVAQWGLGTALAAAPPGVLHAESLRLDATVLIFVVIASTTTGLLCGLVPAMIASGRASHSSLAAGTRVSGTPARLRFRQVVIVSDVAFALVLLTGAGLMLRSVSRLLDVDPGFDRRGLETLQLDVSGPAYGSDATGQAALRAYFQGVFERVSALGGVQSVGAVSELPLGGDFDRYLVEIDGRPFAGPQDAPTADRYIATPSYLSTMRIPVIRGRGLENGDSAGGMRVALIGETFARRWWPGQNPVGSRIRIGGSTAPWMTIVGVVGDVRHETLDAAMTNQLYLPFAQSEMSTMMLVVRAPGATNLESRLRDAIWAVDRQQPILKLATMDRVVDRSMATRRFAMLMLEGFAVAALMLAAIGIYGVIAASVEQRTREIGVRLALGERPGHLVGAIVAGALRVMAAGIVIGMVAAGLLARSLATLLFSVSALDGATFAAVGLVVASVGLVAALVPAMRAARVDPLRSLRAE
jgi:putative ABC transport system permease protein